MYEEYRERNPEYYWTMIRGLVSEGVRGRVFKNWKPIPKKEFEQLPYPSEFGMDFGFASDPTALVEIKRHNKIIVP
jgi:phage terminase large subunit